MDVIKTMDILGWVNTYSGALTFFATLILVVVTAIYVKYTQKIMESAKEQFVLQQNPVIGIQTDEMYIIGTRDDDYREFNIEYTLTNLGNAPALEVLVDSEIKLNFTDIEGEKIIPSRWDSLIPYIRSGEELSGKSFCAQSFNSDAVTHIIRNFQKERELKDNLKKEEQEPECDSIVLLFDIYCKNSFNQYFKSHFETHLFEGSELQEYIEVKPLFSPNQKFYSIPISENNFKIETELRKKKREKLHI